jgi:hypothetical protein
LSLGCSLGKFAVISALEEAAVRELGFVISLSAVLAFAPSVSHAQSGDAFAKALHVYDSYRIVPNISYLTANNWDAKLDV